MIAMMGKPLASLSSGLLARKGQAKPAMRSQGFAGFAPQLAHPAALEDLGWNDMGSPEPTQQQPVAPIPVPPVVALREALKEEIESPRAETPTPVEPEADAPVVPTPPEPEAPIAVKPISLATAARIGRESAKQTKGGKAAFTLRLDAERHLRLRLASALSHRSAQALVTAAVDHFLTSMPEVEAMIAELPKAKRGR